MSYTLSKKSLSKLEGVNPRLVQVVKLAITLTEKDFTVLQGLRTKEEQLSLVKAGKSQTMNSKHLKQANGYGSAVDLIPYPVSWKLEDFYEIMIAMQKASKQLNIRVRWGGAWVCITDTDKTPQKLIEEYSKARKRVGNPVFIDAPHFELM